MRLQAPRWRWRATAVAALLVAGCGDDSNYANAQRPPVPDRRHRVDLKTSVSVSPATFGAGPIRLIVTNQTGRSQQVTLETADDPGSATPASGRRPGPINPRETASLEGERQPGHLPRPRQGRRHPAAELVVGQERASAQNDLSAAVGRPRRAASPTCGRLCPPSGLDGRRADRAT